MEVSSQNNWFVEEAIRYKFIPAVTGHTDLSENKRHILSLPAKAGRLDIPIPMVLAKEEHENSHSITEPLLQAITQQKRDG